MAKRKAKKQAKQNACRIIYPSEILNNYPVKSKSIVEIAIDSIRGIQKSYCDGVSFNGRELKAAVSVASEIRIAWSNEGLMLSDVPLARNLDWPDKQDFFRLEQWFLNTLAAMAKIDSFEGIAYFPKDEETPKAETTGNISGMSWQVAMEKAEKIIDKEGYQGKNKLQKAVGCAEGTLDKAIKKSPKLKEAKRQHKSCSSKAVNLPEGKIDPSEAQLSEAEVTEILNDLLEQTAERKPEILEQTKTQLAGMDFDGKRKLAQEFQKNNTDWDLPKKSKQYKQT